MAVTARNTDTNVVRTTVTNESGVYTLVGLAPGPYELSAEARGFKRAARASLVLDVAQAARIDFKLELGAAAEVVNITAEAPVTDTETASTGTVIDNKKLVELPLNGRQFYNLALLVTDEVCRGMHAILNSGRVFHQCIRAEADDFRPIGTNTGGGNALAMMDGKTRFWFHGPDGYRWITTLYYTSWLNTKPP